MTDSSSDYSKGLTDIFRSTYVKAGGKIVAEESYLQKDQDYKPILTKIKAQNPDLLYIPGYYEDVGKIIKQARELGMTIPVLGADAWDSPVLVEMGGAQPLNNTYFTNFYSIEDKNPVSNAFVEAYKNMDKHQTQWRLWVTMLQNCWSMPLSVLIARMPRK